MHIRIRNQIPIRTLKQDGVERKFAGVYLRALLHDVGLFALGDQHFEFGLRQLVLRVEDKAFEPVFGLLFLAPDAVLFVQVDDSDTTDKRLDGEKRFRGKKKKK